MKSEIEILKDIIKNEELVNKIHIQYVDTSKQYELSNFTTDPELLELKFMPFPSPFYGVFISPGEKEKYTILLNESIKGTGKLYDTLSHEVYHLLFYVSNRKLIDSDFGKAYSFLDEFNARYSGYKFLYQTKLFEVPVFIDDNISTIEKNCCYRLQRKYSDYELAGLLASLLIVDNLRKLPVDYDNAFGCINSYAIRKLINELNNINFYNIKERDLKKISTILEEVYDKKS